MKVIGDPYPISVFRKGLKPPISTILTGLSVFQSAPQMQGSETE